MSQKAVQAFFEKVESDRALQAKLRKVEKANQLKAIADTVEIAATAGFTFTATDFAKLFAKRPKPLSEFGRSGALMANCCYYAQDCMPSFVGH